ncbi:MAG: phosphatase PAP2 family protein [Lachnospiraceae bacterium]|nr:phosphatase PAP2 family protein [Lachnospiraceae bacterium]
MKKMKCFYEKYRHGIPLIIYMTIYLTWFAWLEKTNVKNYQVIHVALDDYIPFCELFVVPYLLWFLYVAAVVVYLFFKNKQDYYKLCVFLFTGMTVFLIVSTLWPNGHHLRPAVLPRDNIFTRLVALLWKTDTPTNLWPSIHVFNSMGAHFAVMHNRELTSAKWGRKIKIASGILSVSIILSTIFIKQHSLFDVATGILMGSLLYLVVYRKEWLLAGRPEKKNNRTPQAG